MEAGYWQSVGDLPRERLAREISDREQLAPEPTQPKSSAILANGTRSAADSPEAKQEDWTDRNHRRAELIRKKNRSGLSPEELAEYEKLQSLSQAALERAFPAPTVGDEDLARIEARLETTPAVVSE